MDADEFEAQIAELERMFASGQMRYICARKENVNAPHEQIQAQKRVLKTPAQSIRKLKPPEIVSYDK